MVIKAENTTFKSEFAKDVADDRRVPGYVEAQKREAAKSRTEQQNVTDAKQRRIEDDAARALSFLDYQAAAVSTAVYPEAGSGSPKALTYCFAAVAEEVGELNGKWAKWNRDGGDPAVVRDAIIKEMGDVLWNLANLSNEIDIALSEVAQRNVDKLASRSERGVLNGSGDDR